MNWMKLPTGKKKLESVIVEEQDKGISKFHF